MSAQVNYIQQILQKNEVIHTPSSLPRLKMPSLKSSDFYAEVKRVYQELGGQKADVPFHLNDFSYELHKQALVVDDATHFNQYRSKTLQSSLYDLLEGVDVSSYQRFCRQYQKDCLAAASHSELWTDKISERHFGESNESGDLGLNGSAAWKMRAFSDFLTDVSSLILPYKLVRISIYDSLFVKGKITPLKAILLSRKEENEKVIFSYMTRKLGLVKKDIKQFMTEELNKLKDDD